MYKKLVDGFAMIGEALQEIGESKETPQVKLLVGQLTKRLNLADPELGEIIAMIRFAVENDDLELKKLTAQLMGSDETN